ncbi:MAG: DUF3221 domain-containing protein [Coriobacteriales bacterium]|nr:YobA family protein [Actinomycetes bacterium]
MRARRATRCAAVAALLLLTLAGCSPAPPDTAPSIPAGRITHVSPGADGLGTIMVESSDPAAVFDKASLAVTDKTDLLLQTSDGYARATFADLTEGTRVDVWVFGAVAESYPVQGTADVVVVVR